MCSAISKKRATTSIPFDGYVGGGLHIMLFWNEVYQMGCVCLPRRFLEQSVEVIELFCTLSKIKLISYQICGSLITDLKILWNWLDPNHNWQKNSKTSTLCLRISLLEEERKWWSVEWRKLRLPKNNAISSL